MLTLLMKKHTHQNTWYLFQVTDGDGYPQVSLAPRLLHPRCSWVSSGTSPAQLLSQLVILEPPCSTPVPTLEATRSPPIPFCWKVFLSDPSTGVMEEGYLHTTALPSWALLLLLSHFSRVRLCAMP